MCRLSDQKLLKFQVAGNCKKILIVEKYDKKKTTTQEVTPFLVTSIHATFQWQFTVCGSINNFIAQATEQSF